jgi:hypothetical protein
MTVEHAQHTTARARSRARENFRTLHTLRIDSPGHVAITRLTSPAS